MAFAEIFRLSCCPRLTLALLFSTGTMIFPTLAFWLSNALLLLVDTTGKPSFITRYRIQVDKNSPVCPVLHLSQYLLQFHFMRILSLSYFFLIPKYQMQMVLLLIPPLERLPLVPLLIHYYHTLFTTRSFIFDTTPTPPRIKIILWHFIQ